MTRQTFPHAALLMHFTLTQRARREISSHRLFSLWSLIWDYQQRGWFTPAMMGTGLGSTTQWTVKTFCYVWPKISQTLSLKSKSPLQQSATTDTALNSAFLAFGNSHLISDSQTKIAGNSLLCTLGTRVSAFVYLKDEERGSSSLFKEFQELWHHHLCPGKESNPC